jgi:7-carboxy-7-deazaguanine synthase
MSKSSSSTLPVMETFYTVQGEGFHAGTPAYFIRLGGCDVGCVWCDVKESWDAARHPQVPIADLVEEVRKSGAPIVVVTGGEPAMHDLTALTSALNVLGVRKHIETSGAHTLTGDWDWVTFSPKKFKEPVSSIYGVTDELKVVVFHKSDLEWAQEHALKVNEFACLFLQPEWEKREQMTPHILDYIRSNTSWRISVQTHKYMGVD